MIPPANGMALERSGHGPPLLLIHGLGGPAMWERVAERLMEDFEVLVTHLPGFGSTPPSTGVLTSVEHAAALSSMMDNHGAHNCTVAGISYGGLIAARLALDHPSLVSRLFLICPTGMRAYPSFVRTRTAAGIARYFLGTLLPGSPRLAGFLSRRSFHDPDLRPAGLVDRYMENLSRPGHAEALWSALHDIAAQGAVLPDLIAGLAQPVTVIWGAMDRVTPVPELRQLRTSRRDVRTIVLGQTGHSVPLERPGAIVQLLRETQDDKHPG